MDGQATGDYVEVNDWGGPERHTVGKHGVVGVYAYNEGAVVRFHKDGKTENILYPWHRVERLRHAHEGE